MSTKKKKVKSRILFTILLIMIGSIVSFSPWLGQVAYGWPEYGDTQWQYSTAPNSVVAEMTDPNSDDEIWAPSAL